MEEPLEDQLEKTCGNCALRLGEECGGYKYEGIEVYDDDEACDEWEMEER